MEYEELQKSLVGSLLQNPDQIAEVIHILQDRRVCNRKWQSIYDNIVKLWVNNEVVDIISVSNITGKYSVDIAEAATSDTVSLQGAGTYAKLLVESHLRRALDDLGRSVSERARRGDDAFDVLETAESGVFKLSSGLVRKEYVTVGDAAKSALKRILNVIETGPVGIPTGLGKLDDTLGGGLQDEDLIILAGRPSAGKTALGLAIASHAIATGHPVGLISAEMSNTQLGSRLIGLLSGVDTQRMMLGIISNDERRQVEKAVSRLEHLPLYIEDTGSITVHETRARARKLKMEKGISLLVVDYLQLLSGGSKHSSTREQEVSYISKVLKNTAKELRLPVLCLSQLSRAVELRQDKKPQLSDLRESGAIEQDADVVMFIWGDNNEAERGLLVAKQRNGPLAEYKLIFEKNVGRFSAKTEQTTWMQ